MLNLTFVLNNAIIRLVDSSSWVTNPTVIWTKGRRLTRKRDLCINHFTPQKWYFWVSKWSIVVIFSRILASFKISFSSLQHPNHTLLYSLFSLFEQKLNDLTNSIFNTTQKCVKLRYQAHEINNLQYLLDDHYQLLHDHKMIINELVESNRGRNFIHCIRVFVIVTSPNYEVKMILPTC